MTKVAIGLPTAGTPQAEFMSCLFRMKEYDSKLGGHHLDHFGWMISRKNTSVTISRNLIVRMFLDTDSEWLLFIDDDETFDPDIIDRLLETADPVDYPIVSGLVMAYREERAPNARVRPACVLLDEAGLLRAPDNIPPQRPWEVAAVGAGCLFVHRSVYEKMLEERPDSAFPWFENLTWNREGSELPDAMGEDYVFSLRAGKAGFKVVVDTDIVCGHRKLYEFTPDDFWAHVPFDEIAPRCYAVIPVKDGYEMTEHLVRQLRSQPGCDGILILDNGSNHKTRRRLAQLDVEIVPAVDMGIHEMWNLGAEIALRRWPKVDLAFLNNDLDIGPDFLASLSADLRDETAPTRAAISPNYDGRELDAPEPQNQICANRYDGTGGAPGFAFMVKGEWFQLGYRFPEDAKWWFGDNDLLLAIRAAGGEWAITPNATVTHIGGGGQTGDWDAYQKSPQYDIDRKAFLARWAS